LRRKRKDEIYFICDLNFLEHRKKTRRRKVTAGGITVASPSVTADIFLEKRLDSARVKLARPVDVG
jgi:deoxyadenosine/deoxycytidine kinase